VEAAGARGAKARWCEVFLLSVGLGLLSLVSAAPLDLEQFRGRVVYLDF